MFYVEVYWHEEIRVRSREVSYPLWLVWGDRWLSLVDPKLDKRRGVQKLVKLTVTDEVLTTLG